MMEDADRLAGELLKLLESVTTAARKAEGGDPAERVRKRDMGKASPDVHGAWCITVKCRFLMIGGGRLLDMELLKQTIKVLIVIGD
jgi:hypothetical protein